jgi:hypothetical protein
MKTTIRDIKGNDADRILGFSEQGGYPQITNQDSSKIIEITDDKAEIGNKRQYQNEGNYSGSKIAKRGDKMDIDQPNTSTSQNPKTNQENSDSRANFELLSDDEIEKADKDQLIDLNKRIRNELEIRKQVEANSSSSFQTSNYRISTQELKAKLQKSESALNSFQTSSPNADKKNDNAGIIVGTIAVASALAIGSIALIKNKLGKNKKK